MSRQGPPAWHAPQRTPNNARALVPEQRLARALLADDDLSTGVAGAAQASDMEGSPLVRPGINPSTLCGPFYFYDGLHASIQLTGLTVLPWSLAPLLHFSLD